MENIAYNLATDLLKAGAQSIRSIALGNEQQRALHTAYQYAFGEMVAEGLSILDSSMQRSLLEILNKFFNDDDVKDWLVDSVLIGIIPTQEQIQPFFAKYTSGDETKLELINLVGIFMEALKVELRVNSEDPKSPLFNMFVVGKLDQISDDVRTIKENFQRLDIFNTNSKIAAPPVQTILGIPKPPAHYLFRERESTNIQNLLLESTQAYDIESTIGIYGMGGSGKSVLAAMVVRGESVAKAFPDGIFWLIIGQNPQLISLQSRLIGQLGGGEKVFTGIDDGNWHLNSLLNGKRCLIVLDDIWKTNDLRAFKITANYSRVLVTTRDKRLLETAGAKEYPVGILTDEEAVELLAGWVDKSAFELPPKAKLVAEECGNLPLALAIAGAMARNKPNRWGYIHSLLQNADLERLGRDFPDYPYPNLLKAIQVSVDDLPADTQQLYFDFALFRDDVGIPDHVFRILWCADV